MSTRPIILALIALALAACSGRTPLDAHAADAPQAATPAAKAPAFRPPDASAIPAGPYGDMVRLGREIFLHTRKAAPAYVGNGLNCVNCHLDAGRLAGSAPLWGA